MGRYLCTQMYCCSVLAFTWSAKPLLSFSIDFLDLLFCLGSSHPAYTGQNTRRCEEWSFLNEGLNHVSLGRMIVLNCCPSAGAPLELGISMLWSTSLHRISDLAAPKNKWPSSELLPSHRLVARKFYFSQLSHNFHLSSLKHQFTLWNSSVYCVRHSLC